MQKLKLWEGQKITGTDITIKLDGIQVMLNELGKLVSRSGKESIHNLDPALLEPWKKYECFLGSFKETDSVLSTHDHPRKVQKHELYEIWPGTDPRLKTYLIKGQSIQDLFEYVLTLGHEGLVLDKKYKVKKFETFDVPIIDYKISKEGQFKGLLGAYITPMGDVGTGLTKAMREQPHAIGTIIEVECMELTEKGKFRHARYVRERWDKDISQCSI
jgi:hypothetical protein